MLCVCLILLKLVKFPFEEFRCECLPGFGGDLCETNIDDCLNNPCGEFGTCMDLIDSFDWIFKKIIAKTSCVGIKYYLLNIRRFYSINSKILGHLTSGTFEYPNYRMRLWCWFYWKLMRRKYWRLRRFTLSKWWYLCRWN